MSGRQYQPFINNSLAIRQEIQRFESVHPSIYAIYDLIELIPDAVVSQQIREHVVCIEGKLSKLAVGRSRYDVDWRHIWLFLAMRR